MADAILPEFPRLLLQDSNLIRGSPHGFPPLHERQKQELFRKKLKQSSALHWPDLSLLRHNLRDGLRQQAARDRANELKLRSFLQFHQASLRCGNDRQPCAPAVPRSGNGGDPPAVCVRLRDF